MHAMNYWKKMYYILLVFIYICALNGHINAKFANRALLGTPNIAKSEFTALHELYLSTNGSHWTWNATNYVVNILPGGKPWDFSNPKANPCADNWEGIGCECLVTECYVVGLSLSSHNLQGTIPSGLKNLTRLTLLNLSNNTLIGTIPSSLMEIPNLRSIFIFSNFLTGPIPSNIYKLKELRTLSVFINNLQGTVPESLYSCTKLNTIVLSVNNFTGTISNSLGNLLDLEYFIIDVNYFHGKIPASLGNIRGMRQLDMALNYFTGNIPATIGNFQNISAISFFSNKLTGTIPDVFAFNQSEVVHRNTTYYNFTVSSLTTVKLQYNYFSGTLPKTITTNDNLLSLYFQNNLLTGTVPKEFSRLKKLSVVRFDGNAFHGNLEQQQIQTSLLTYLDVSSNQFTGSVPVFNAWQYIIFYITENNYFTGKFEINFCDTCHQLFQIDISSNYLHGGFLTWEQKETVKLSSLQQLFVSNNLLSGSITLGVLVDSHHLTEIFLDHNFLKDVVPLSLITLPFLQQLNLQDNMLEGTIAKEYFVSSSLQNLFLQNNRFEGKLPELAFIDEVLYPTQAPTKFPLYASAARTIPGEYASYALMSGSNDTIGVINETRLLSVDISSNGITGTLPVSWFHTLTALESFAAVENCFSGSISESICEAQQLLSLALDGLTSGSNCRIPLFPGISRLDAFILATHIDGSIPNCLFSMPKLQTLHLSGNSLIGSLSSTLNISQSLMDIDLSHNRLTGSIPDNFQFRIWNNLALSYNKLNGELKVGSFIETKGGVDVVQTASLSMKVNRLSGKIPSSIVNIQDIDILDGNFFTCDNEVGSDNELPSHDGKATTYSCGSNNIYNLLYLWLFLLFMIVVILSIYSYYRFYKKPSKLSNQKVAAHELQSGRITTNDIRPSDDEDDPDLEHTKVSEISVRSTNVRVSTRVLFPFLSRSSEITNDEVKDDDSLPQHGYFYQCMMNIGAILDQYVRNMKQLNNLFALWKGMLIVDRKHTRFGKTNPIAFFAYYTKTIRKLYFYLTILLICIYMPVYGFLSLADETYAQEYIWTMSAVLLSGPTPGIVITVFFLTFIVAVVLIFEYYIMKIFREWKETRLVQEAKLNRYMKIYYAFLHFINFIVMLIIDIVYVLIYITYGSAVVSVAQFILAVFKIAWNDLVLWKSLPIVKRWIAEHLVAHEKEEQAQNIPNPTANTNNAEHNTDVTARDNEEKEEKDFKEKVTSEDEESPKNNIKQILEEIESTKEKAHEFTVQSYQPTMQETVHLLILSLSNNIIVPLLAIALVDPHCFYNAIFAADAVESSYSYVSCGSFLVLFVKHYVCTSAIEVSEQTSYDPPFIYSYQCSSSIVINYVPVYFIMFFMIGIFIPLGKVLCKLWYDFLDKENLQHTKIYQFLEAILPKNLRKLREHRPDDGGNWVLFEKHRFVVIVSTYLCVLLSFGVVFPPLAIIGCISIITYTHYHELVVGRLLFFADKLGYTWYKQQLEYDCDDIAAYFSVHLWLLLRLSGIVLGYIVFDTFGDAVGWNVALGPTILVYCFPVFCVFALFTFRAYLQNQRNEEVLRYLATRTNPEDSPQAVTKAKLTLSSRQFEANFTHVHPTGRFLTSKELTKLQQSDSLSSRPNQSSLFSSPSEAARKTGDTRDTHVSHDTGSDVSILEMFRASFTSYPMAMAPATAATAAAHASTTLATSTLDSSIESPMGLSEYGVELTNLPTIINPLQQQPQQPQLPRTQSQ